MAMAFFCKPWYLWRNKYLFSKRYRSSEFRNRNSNFLTLQTSEFKKKIRPESLESKMESEFRLQSGSQKLEPKIGIFNLGCPRMKETPLSFHSFDSTWLSMVSLARDTTTTQPAFNFFYQNDYGNFCLCCCRCSLHLFCCHSGRCQSTICVACPVSVAHVKRGAIVTWLYFFNVFASSLLCVLLLFLMFSSWEIWGMNVPNLPEVSHLRTSWFLAAFVALALQRLMLLVMMIVITGWVLLWYSLMTPLLRLLVRLPCGSEADCYGFPRCIRGMLILWALWRFTMMVSVASIAISDGFDLWLHPSRLAMALLPVVACCNCA